MKNRVIELESEKAATEEKEKTISNAGSSFGGTECFIDNITERFYGTKDGCPAFEGACSNLKKKDPPSANVH